jgi:hypothetical protein
LDQRKKAKLWWLQKMNQGRGNNLSSVRYGTSEKREGIIEREI